MNRVSEITNTAIYQILTDLSANSINRQETSVWAEEVRDKWSISTPGGSHFQFPSKIKYWEGAWAAVANALLHESCEQDGYPYFMRPFDYVEWLAILKQESTPELLTKGIRPIRYHQLRQLFHPPVAAISFPHDRFVERLGTNALHGVGGLDYLREFIFETTWGEQFSIENLPRHYPKEHYVYVEQERFNEWEKSIDRLLEMLGLTMDDVSWQREISLP